MTIKDLLLHMADGQYVAVYIGRKKEFEGRAGLGVLHLPNCILDMKVKQIGSVDYIEETKAKGLFDRSVITIVTEA